ncbi:hypothetical protein CORC01_12226 [Colletotrichum orchidophilum]|uniref:Uncharacterized protein n=1 Tax=Colletotrichum orchidophilum TaxID=1209926 RepID=A0A1G4ATN5_9PEZI|nr:uncharacterized protein CORC01_12226 [Colletotrichum orchidophilum]OHE92508.1 hypothetical protein CORC01_12226 [Colletotrichum orchidophilum]
MCVTIYVVRICAECGKEISRLKQNIVSCKNASQSDPKCPEKKVEDRIFKKLCAYCHPACSCFSDESLNKILGSDWDFSAAHELEEDHPVGDCGATTDDLDIECYCVKKMRLLAIEERKVHPKQAKLTKK